MDTSSGISVRELEPPDVLTLRAMLAAADLPTAEIDRAGARYIKLCRGGETIAFAGLEAHGRDALLRSVVVHPVERGRGAGRHVVEAALAGAAKAGIATVYLLTTTAPEFFARLGFAVVPRDQVPPAIARTSEFATLCPASAVCMRKDIRPRA